LPTPKQTLFFSATMPAPIATLAHEMLKNPVTLNLARKATPAVGITQAIYPVAQDLKTSLLVALLNRGEMKEALVFTRTKHRANRLAEQLGKQKINVARIHGNRSQAQRTDALEGFKSGRYRVLVATDIAARGIDVEELGHVVNFDVPLVPEDYIHRVGRTARAEATGDAFTFVAPNEESDLRAIEQAIGKRLPRVTVPDFDYSARATERFEVPIADRIAEIRKRKSEERARAKVNAERRAGHGTGGRPAGGGHGRPAGAGSGSGAGAHRSASRPGGQPGGGGGGRPGGGGGGGRPGGGGPAGARGGSFGPRRPGGSPSGPRRGGSGGNR
jgi:ATP-dependent RNA helicase RhlE